MFEDRLKVHDEYLENVIKKLQTVNYIVERNGKEIITESFNEQIKKYLNFSTQPFANYLRFIPDLIVYKNDFLVPCEIKSEGLVYKNRNKYFMEALPFTHNLLLEKLNFLNFYILHDYKCCFPRNILYILQKTERKIRIPANRWNSKEIKKWEDFFYKNLGIKNFSYYPLQNKNGSGTPFFYITPDELKLFPKLNHFIRLLYKRKNYFK